MGLTQFLPQDWRDATLLGRIDFGDGPTPVLVRGGRVEDVSRIAPTVADLMNAYPPGSPIPRGEDRGPLEALDIRAVWEDPAGEAAVKLLAPVDLQCLKAAGVTFAVSTLERVIEERARGDAAAALKIREQLSESMGGDLRSVDPGSEGAERLKQTLIKDGLWSQYLEVAIGPDAEIFTKGPTLSSMGWGDHVGVRSDSHWNNPEPEVVLLCDGSGQIRGAALGNDVNLRDFEGRSALLLSKAKDNNASCAIGPFFRLFDEAFSLDDVRSAEVELEITGRDNFVLNGHSNMSLISRDPAVLAGQAFGKQHQYPDGFALFLGTMFAPIQDRDTAGQGFTHKVGDRVRVSTPKLGVLENEVTTCDQAKPWTFGISALIRNLAGRGLL
ncbi:MULTISPECIES: fumarylacetoacetate hydrolase family protein [unclassified Caulobacter]|uniref:fumarylacetoacetate hydrolase family protein n=1 Tax=unclassified Caulobacter TaxID=2648921 RepID=UPI000D33C3AD|nr:MULTISPECIES: fumarylacetoacetate hydrolase family protein [unclassified Caulobacter]PTS87644.1 fumarylacetoacetate hydrolase [Caulobacter sp. HMWF009]PTT10979.1 fumarylacetoacetate hydrolase [Caulobacter sp. HMWF025]